MTVTLIPSPSDFVSIVFTTPECLERTSHRAKELLWRVQPKTRHVATWQTNLGVPRTLCLALPASFATLAIQQRESALDVKLASMNEPLPISSALHSRIGGYPPLNLPLIFSPLASKSLGDICGVYSLSLVSIDELHATNPSSLLIQYRRALPTPEPIRATPYKTGDAQSSLMSPQ